MDANTERRLGHLNLIEYARESTRWSSAGSLAESDGVVCFATGSWVPVDCNGAFRTDDTVDPESVVERARSYFEPLGRGYSVKVRTGGAADEDEDLRAACERAGLVAFGHSSPEMVRREPVEEPELPPGVEIRHVSTPRGVAELAAVHDDAYATYGMPSGEVPKLFDRPAGLLASPHVLAVVAYDRDTPLAGALVILSHGIAGVYWVGTVQRARQAGLGRAVTAAVTNWSFEHGALACTLQASVMGEPVYRHMGYETIGHYRDHVAFRDPPGT